MQVWHRRAGKEKCDFNLMAKKAFERVGTYYYFFPTYAQAKKILWDGTDKSGMKFLDHIPRELIDGKPNDTEMKIKLVNGSLIQLVGTDNYNSIMGTNPIGCVFSEFSLQNPTVWDYIRPILRENGGWAIFNFTPRGRNHGFKLYEMARKNPDWFCQLLTVEDTEKSDGSAIFTHADIEAERAEGMDEDLIQQEYFCSFSGAMQGAYYSKQLKDARAEGRIGVVPYEPELPVDTIWDLGIGDAMSIWFIQTVGSEIRVIDYYESSGSGLDYYIGYLRDKPYKYGDHFAPHDIEVRELTSGRSRYEIAREMGIVFRIVPKLSVDDGINAARAIFSKCWFDEEKCEQGLNALGAYHKEYDEKRKEYKNKPFHDWSSHAADSFRYMAIGYREATVSKELYGDDMATAEQVW